MFASNVQLLKVKKPIKKCINKLGIYLFNVRKKFFENSLMRSLHFQGFEDIGKCAILATIAIGRKLAQAPTNDFK